MVEEIVFWLRAKAEGFDSAAKKAASGMNEVGAAYAAAESQIKASMKRIPSYSDDAVKKINKSYKGISAKQLIDDLASLEDSIAAQRGTIAKAQEDYNRLFEAATKYKQALSSDDPFADFFKPASLASAEQEIQSLTSELDSMLAKSKELADAAVLADMSERNKAALDAEKASLQGTKDGLQGLSDGLRAVNVASGGSIKGLDGITTQLSALKRSMGDTASIGSKMVAGITTSIAVGGMLIQSVITDIQKAKEEALKEARESVDGFQVANQDISDAERYIKVLKNQKTTLEDANEAKNALASLFPAMVQGYDDEGNAILQTTQQMEAYVDVLRTKNELETASAGAGFSVLLDDLISAANEYAQISQTWLDRDAQYFENNPLSEAAQTIEHGQAELFEKLDETKTAFRARMSSIFGADITNDLSPQIENMFSDLWEEIAQATKRGDTSALKKVQKNLTVKIQNAINLNDVLDDVKKSGKDIGEELENSIINSVMQYSTNIDNKALQKIVEKATEIDTKSVEKDLEGDFNGLKSAVIAMFAQAGDTISSSDAAAWTDAILNLARGDAKFQELLKGGDANAIRDYIVNKANELAVDGSNALLNAYNGLIPFFNMFAGLFNQLPGQVSTYKPKAAKRSGGSKTKTNTALENELNLLEHKKALNEVTAQEEIAWLERVYRQYAKTTEEKWDLEERMYALRMQLQEDEIEYKKTMDQLTLREEIAANERLLSQYKKGTDERKELEKTVYELKKDLQRQEYDLDVYYGKLTLSQQESRLKQMIAQYKAGTETRIELEQELYDVQQQIYERNIQIVDSVLEAITQALQNRYDEQQKIEEERIQGSIDAWEKWGEEQVDAIQAQIDALDDMTKEEDRAEEERKKRRKIAALEQQLQYEQDAYNQRKLAEQLAQAQKELDDWLRKNEREDQKEALQEQIDKVNDQVKAEQDKLNEQLEANEKYYEELTKQQNLQAEAQKILMENTQKDILELIKGFAPDYNLTGQSLGEQLVDGFKSSVGDVEKWFDGLTKGLQEYQAQMAIVATQAADKFYKTHNVIGQSNGQAASASQAPSFTINFNEPVESPTQVRRELERFMESMFQMM